jgi:glycopeptide antibiotics resistance protein
MPLIHDGHFIAIPGYWMILPAIPVGLWIVRRYRRGEADERWVWFALLAMVHITATIALTIFPIPIAGQGYVRIRGVSDNIIPFATILTQATHPSLSNYRQLIGNALALMPLGVYAPALWPRFRDLRRFVILAIACGVGIELTQFAGSLMEGFTYRVTDIDDAMMNAAGAIAAFLAWPYIWPRLWPLLEPYAQPLRKRLTPELPTQKRPT